MRICMNETQQFNLYRHLTIQALKALTEYLIRMTKDEINESKDYYFKHFESIYKYVVKAEQSKLPLEESIELLIFL